MVMEKTVQMMKNDVSSENRKKMIEVLRTTTCEWNNGEIQGNVQTVFDSELCEERLQNLNKGRHGWVCA